MSSTVAEELKALGRPVGTEKNTQTTTLTLTS